jgi:catechol 2,3-dioxygenase-like lactoylglutathione lyase family enzyme
MIKALWNIGVKTADLEADLAFLEQVGAVIVQRDALPVDGGETLDYAIVRLGGVRLLLFPSVIFEDQIPGGVAPGLTHAVFEVDDIQAEYERIRGLGGQVLIAPTLAQAGFGSRQIAFFRAPGGLVLEIIQILENKVD